MPIRFITLSETQKLVADRKWNGDVLDSGDEVDESVRFMSYNDFDFLSLLVYPTVADNTPSEVNIFFTASELIIAADLDLSSLHSVLQAAYEREKDLGCLLYVLMDFFITIYAKKSDRAEDAIENLINSMAQGLETRKSTKSSKPTKTSASQMIAVRAAAYELKKIVAALAYVPSQIIRDENKNLTDEAKSWFADLNVRLARLSDHTRSVYELSNEMFRFYDSTVTLRMNRAISVMTVVMLIFEPLMVITGIYGMNFEFMPELEWKYGYFGTLGLLFFIALGIAFYAKRKGWFKF